LAFEGDVVVAVDDEVEEQVASRLRIRLVVEQCLPGCRLPVR